MQTKTEVAHHHVTVTLWDLFKVFGNIGVSSFGGGLSGWMYREVVERRKWISQEDFWAGMSVARPMPGVNVINLAIWIGYQLRGGIGALTAICAVLVGPIALIMIFALLYQRWSHSDNLHQALLGITAAALALNVTLVLKSFQAAATKPFYIFIILALFVSIGILHWPMMPVMAVLTPISIVWSMLKDKDAR